MKKSRVFLMATLILLLIPATLYAEIYKCIDENGKVIFTTRPGPGCTLLPGSVDEGQPTPKQKTVLNHKKLPAKEHRAIKVATKQKERRVALLIGNGNYIRGGSLDNPVNDVRAMKRALEGLGFTVLKYENCSQKTMKKAMDKFGRKLRGQDVGLFFFSGHGVQARGHNYLIPTDAKLDNENDAEYNCVRAGRILANMESARSKTNIVILDSCRHNPFERSWRRGTEGAGLAFMNAPSGSLIAYSTAPGKTASDGAGKNSPYTAALLQHIDTPNITVLQMFQRVRSTVMKRTANQQIPWEATSLKGDFCFSSQGQDNWLDQEQARLERERREVEQMKEEFERKKLESQSQKDEVASFPQKPSNISSSSTSNVVRRDGTYVFYDNNIIEDTITGLQWVLIIDRKLTSERASSWAANLSLDGGGWHLPTRNQLETLEQFLETQRVGEFCVWSTTSSRGDLYCFGFAGDDQYRFLQEIIQDETKNRAFAVRSRNDG